MGKHVADWTPEHGWAEALAYEQAPRFSGYEDPDFLNRRLTRGRHVHTTTFGTARGHLLSAEAWKKEKP